MIRYLLPFTILLFLCLAAPAHAFGAGNIASVAKIEGHNWRHGDIEDTLKTLLMLRGAKWSAMNIRRVYFGNWLRDYSQALDVGTLKSVQKDTIRVLVWVLSFLSFGYATGEFEVTEERLGVYRPEEHIDNPKDYADNLDARHYDPRLRPPVHPAELGVDPATGMKNYIANEAGGWATSSRYVKDSLSRCIHHGRLYTSGAGNLGGKEKDLCEALRCLGQALHCLEDFSAHTNYIELVLREMGFTNVFTHTGERTESPIGVAQHQGYPAPYGGYGQTPQAGGKMAFPLVTGTFGAVDFLHSVLGEAQDKFAQTEVDELDIALNEAHEEQKRGSRSGQKSVLIDLLSQVPNCNSLGGEADKLQARAEAQEMQNLSISSSSSRSRAPGAAAGSFDPVQTARDIYPILQFRDNVMRSIEAAIEKIPGLTALVERISDTLSVFVLSLLAPYVRPIIAQASEELKAGSSVVVNSSAQHQYEPWTDPFCTDPTHSLLSKDHFSNKLNTPAGEVASAIVTFAVPRIVYAWENPSTPVELVLNDIVSVFHHPALRNPQAEVQTLMFEAVRKWVERLPDHGRSLNDILSRDSVRQGKNHESGVVGGGCNGGHGKTKDSEWARREKKKKKEGKGKKGEVFPGITTGGGTVNVGGMKLSGALGGMVGGFLDAAAASQLVQSGGKEGKYKDEEKKKDKHKEKEKDKKKDKYDEYGYDSRDEKKEKKNKEGKYKEDKYKEDKYKEGKYKEDKYKEDKYKDDKHKDKKDKDKKDKDKKSKSSHSHSPSPYSRYDNDSENDSDGYSHGHHHQSSSSHGYYYSSSPHKHENHPSSSSHHHHQQHHYQAQPGFVPVSEHGPYVPSRSPAPHHFAGAELVGGAIGGMGVSGMGAGRGGPHPGYPEDDEFETLQEHCDAMYHRGSIVGYEGHGGYDDASKGLGGEHHGQGEYGSYGSYGSYGY